MFKILNFIYMSISSQIWLHVPIVDCHFSYIIKLTTQKEKHTCPWAKPNSFKYLIPEQCFLFFPNLWSNWIADRAQEELAKMARRQKGK